MSKKEERLSTSKAFEILLLTDAVPSSKRRAYRSRLKKGTIKEHSKMAILQRYGWKCIISWVYKYNTDGKK